MTLTKEQAMFTSDTAKYKIIGICTSCVQSDYVREIVSSISRKGVKEGYKVLLFNTFCDLYHNSSYNHGEASIFDLINYDILDVLIIMPEAIKRDSISNEISKRAHEHGVPVICVDSTMDNCCSVTFNYSDVFEKIVRHVIEFHGCRRVNFIAGVKGNAFSEERIEAYKKVLAENGIEFEPERLGYGDFWDMPTKGVLEKFLESDLEFPQAIICANDAMAIAACSILRERGIKVPEDVIVTGFDGIELEQYNSPRLTTAAVDNDVLGEKIINAIDHMMNGVPLPEKIEVNYTMRISQSCGCKKIDPREVGDKILELYHRMNNSDGHEQHMFSYLAKTVECHTVEEMAKVMARSGDYYSWVCTNSDFLSNTRRFINNTNQIMESFKNRQRLERANAELARIHMLDPMTGIYNRRGFYKNVRKLISKAEKQGVGVWVFSIDMDNLKKINDLYGHNEGDKAIKAVASLMTKCTAEGGICSRFGGDEFVAVIAETDGADSFYEKVSRSIAEYNRRSKSPYDVSISCGYKAGKPKTLKEIDDLMKASDREMYTQKRKHHSRRD